MMKSLWGCIVLWIVLQGSAMAASPCEPEKLAQKYPTLVGTTVVIGVSPFYVPFSFMDPNKPGHFIGNDIELSEAALTCVGVKYDYLYGNFTTLLPNITSGRIDAMVANVYVTPERSKSVNFVTYMRTGAAMLVHKGNPHRINSMDDLCGFKTNATVGSYSLPILEKIQDKCRSEGKPAFTIDLTTEADVAFRQLLVDRVDFLLDNVGSGAARVAANPDVIEIAFTNVTEILVGVGIRKDNEALLQAYTEGFKTIEADGTMAKIFDKYKLDRKLIAAVEIRR